MSEYALVGGLIFDGNTFLEKDTVVIIKNNKVHMVCLAKDLPKNIEQIRVDDLLIAPAFIDLQLNGCGGVLLNDSITENTLEIMHQTNLKSGCTSFLPTLITAQEEDVKQAVDVVKTWYKKNPNKAIGVHIEGPYLNIKKKGAHNPSYIKILSAEMVDFFMKAVKEIPIMLTLAPECNNLQYIKKLTDAGVVISIGHSNANYEEAMAGINYGIKTATHLFNAMPTFEGRNPGVIGAVFNTDEVSAGIIVDGHHVNFANVALAKKIKGEKLFVVTDAMPLVGTNLTEFMLAGKKIFLKEGRLISAEGTLSGVYITMIESLKNLVQQVGISLGESLRMLSLYPARVIGIENKLGKIKEDFIANLVIFDKIYQVKYTIDNGTLNKNDAK